MENVFVSLKKVTARSSVAVLSLSLSLQALVLPTVANAAATCNGLTATIESNAAVINGTAGNDVIVGGNSANTINGLGGNDTICGGNQNDTIYGGDGNGWIDGQNGSDSVYGEDGNDTIFGSNGGDAVLSGGPGADFCNGGNGPGAQCEAETDQGIVSIVKDAVPNDVQDFAFTGGLGAFSLDDDADGTLSNTNNVGMDRGLML